MPNSAVVIHSSGSVTHQGDAVRLYQARVVRQGLKACMMGLRLNRSYTPTNCLRTAGTFTGKRYGRGKPALTEALADMDQWIAACEAAMPVIVEDDRG